MLDPFYLLTTKIASLRPLGTPLLSSYPNLSKSSPRSAMRTEDLIYKEV